MADLSDITAIDQVVYANGLIPPGWDLLNVAGGSGNKPVDGFLAQAFKNESTGEIVVSIRGTDNSSNYLTDAQLTLHLATQVAADAISFVNAVISQNPDLPTLTLTGHSMGGYAAQAVYAYLDKLPTDPPPNLSAVTFNAPGLPTSLARGLSPGTGAVYNFNTQGDWVHLYGGPQIGKSTTINIGPTVAQEWAAARSGFTTGYPYSYRSGLVGAFSALASSVVGSTPSSAHSLGEFTMYFGASGLPTAPGMQNAQTFFANNEGSSPSANLSVNTVTDSATIGDGVGDSLVFQSAGSGTGLASVLNGSGAGLVGAGSLIGLQSEVAADGSIVLPSTLISQNSGNLFSQLNTYGTVSSGTQGGAIAVVGSSPGGELPGLPNQLFTSNGILNRYEYNVPGTGNTAVETIHSYSSQGTVWTNGADGYNQLTGGTALAGFPETWTDVNGTHYVFTKLPNQTTGTLTISNGLLGSSVGNEIVITDFNMAAAHTAAGYLGIVLPATVSLNATANAGVDPPAPDFTQGSSQSYTLSVDTPSLAAQTFLVSLSGAIPSDFQASVGGILEQLNPNGTFSVTLASGETNVAFTLTDVTPDNGLSDIASGAPLQLSASLPNADTTIGGTIQTAPLAFNYIPTTWNTDGESQPTDSVTGVPNGGGPGVTQFTGDGNDDFVSATTPNNDMALQNSGNDSIVGGSGNDSIVAGNGNDIIVGSGGQDLIIGGNGNSEIYAGSKTSLQNAITQASLATTTGVQGDAITVLDGNNTIIGGNGNDAIIAGDGNNVVVLGPGSDVFTAGWENTGTSPTWTITESAFSPGSLAPTLTYNGFTLGEEYYSNPFLQPYNGSVDVSTGKDLGSGNDTVYGGSGNDTISLGNGHNYVLAGSGADQIFGGMGYDTIIAGSGSDLVVGGGGSTYIEGGSGADTLAGGDGSATIIGGSGNSTIYANYYQPASDRVNFTNANLNNNYVQGGSGNDIIFGSDGNDTLIAGTGNSSIYGQAGQENIVGGSGNDYLIGGTGNDTIAAGGSGVDSLYAIGSSTSTSVLYGGSGIDLISGGSGANTLVAGDGGTAGNATTVFASESDATATTTIYGGLGVDLLLGGTGASVIYGGDGGTSTAPTTIRGDTGTDTLYGGLGTDLVQAGSGNTVLYAGDGGTSAAPTTVLAGSGVDSLFGGAGNALLEDSVSGQDVITSTTGTDSLIGIGSDTLIAGSGEDSIQVNSGNVTVQLNAGIGDDALTNFGGTENLSFGTGIAPTDFSGLLQSGSLGSSYLTVTGDGGSVAIENVLNGVVGSINFADSGSISTAMFLQDVFGGDQTVTNGYGNIVLNLSNSQHLIVGDNGDTIGSWGNNVTISGGDFDPQGHIYSAGANAVITSEYGFDSINSAGANATVTGSTYSDNITISGAGSVARAGLGGDTISASGNLDTVVGSTDSSIYISNASDVVQVSSASAGDTIYASVTYTAPANVANLTLMGSGNISATGNTLADTLTGGAGQDTLVAGAGLATLIGGAGNTTFLVTQANDVVQDTSASATNSIQSSVSYSLVANVNTLTLTGSSALVGTANGANDTLVSNNAIDTLVGGLGNDIFVLNNPLDVVKDSLGTATILYQASAAFTLPTSVNNLTLLGTSAIHATGNAGNDSLIANSGADTLSAGNGSDTLVSGPGIDSLVGGIGNDVFVVNNAADIVSVGATPGNDTIQSSTSFTASANIANLTLVGTTSISGTGNTKTNVLSANSGNDTLRAGSGIATLVGGSGNDTFVVNSASDVVQDTSTTSVNTLDSSISYTLATNVNSLVLTGSVALVGTANAVNDTLSSNSAADTLVGGSGNDLFVIANSGVIIQDTSATAVNAAQSSVTYSLPNNVNTLTLTGTSALRVTANAAADTIASNSGVDTLVAGSGKDTFVLNNALDMVSVGAGYGSVVVQTASSYTLPGNVNATNTLLLTGSANLLGVASSGFNSIVGNAGNDTLKAGSGGDTLVAGSGTDTLIGGSGYDHICHQHRGRCSSGDRRF